MNHLYEGPTALTNRRISEEADTTTQTIYTYFGTRDALIEAMFQRAVEGVEGIISLASSIMPTNPADGDVAGAFRQAALQYREFCLTHPGRFRMLRGIAADVDLLSESASLRERLVDAVAAIGRFGANAENPTYEAHVRLTLAALHGFFEAELDGFITAEHNPSQRYEELVLRCLPPMELIPTSW